LIYCAHPELVEGRALAFRQAQRERFENSDLEIDRDALLLPVAIAGRVQSLLFTSRRSGFGERLRLRNRRRGAQIVWRIELLGTFHDTKMMPGSANAKH
jgi:hypothetical protein